MEQGLIVTELHTQDGYDWPSGCTDERWPADKHQPAAPYFREQFKINTDWHEPATPTSTIEVLPRCWTCADRGVLRVRSRRLGDPTNRCDMVSLCPTCGPK